MKVYPDKLAARLKKDASPIYIVSGDEPLLVQEACDLIRHELGSRGISERDLFHVEGSFDWNSLLYSANSMSLFAEQKLIEIRMPSGKPGDQGSKVLKELAGQLNDDTLLLVLPRLDQASQRTKWFKSLEADGVFVQVWPIEAKQLPRWLDGRFRRVGLKATREAVQIMAERIEGNLLAAVQEIERLKLVVSDQRVDVQDVTESVADSARFDVFKLVDAALVGDVSRCVRMAEGLKSEGAEILFLVNMLSRELRALEAMQMEIVQGGARQAVFKKYRIWDKRAPGVQACLDRHEVGSLRELQGRAGVIDRMVKGVHPGDPWRELQGLILTIAGKDLATLRGRV